MIMPYIEHYKIRNTVHLQQQMHDIWHAKRCVTLSEYQIDEMIA